MVWEGVMPESSEHAAFEVSASIITKHAFCQVLYERAVQLRFDSSKECG